MAADAVMALEAIAAIEQRKYHRVIGAPTSFSSWPFLQRMFVEVRAADLDGACSYRNLFTIIR